MNTIIFTLLLAGLLVLSVKSIHKRETISPRISVETSTCLKGISAVLVAMHHVQQQNVLAKYYLVFGYIGFILVGLFFFLSGYGLAYGFRNKQGYMKSFLKKHLLSIYMPYWIMLLLNTAVRYASGKEFDTRRFVLAILGFSEHWFVTGILLFYLFFYIAFRFVRPEWGKQLLLLVLILSYMIACTRLGLMSSYTASSLCFMLGVEYYLYCDRVAALLRNKQIVLGGVFFLLFFGRLALSYIGITNELLHIVARNMVSISFVIFIVSVFLQCDFYHPFWVRTGKLSYEIFLSHGFLLPLISRYNLLVFVVVTILLAYTLSVFSKLLKGVIQKLWT